jgi:bacteriorhodopsin
MDHIHNILHSVEGKSIKEQSSDVLDASFKVTQVFLVFTAIITFVGAIQTTDKKLKMILGLESLISAMAAYFYSIFVNRFTGKKIKWSELAIVRYQDWTITTPIMLVVLVLVLGFDYTNATHVISMISIIIMDFLMLHFGYLGEMGKIEKWYACSWGFIPYTILFSIIYYVFLLPNSSYKKNVLFGFFVIMWCLYGNVYVLDENIKNILLNIFDAVTKGGMGLWLYTYFI